MIMMRIRRNCAAVEGIPLKLFIAILVAGLSIVPAADALERLNAREFVKRAMLELNKVILAAQVLAIAGPGGVRTLSLDFSSDCDLSMEWLTIGDELGGPNMSSAVVRLSSGASLVRTGAEPPIWMKSPDGGPLQVQSEEFELRMSIILSDDYPFILVEVV